MYGGLAGRDGQLASLDVVSPRLELFIQSRESFHQRASKFIQEFALISRLDFRPTSLEELSAQVALQGLDLQRNGRLRKTQSPRSFGDAPCLDNRAKTLQLLQAVLFVSEYPHSEVFIPAMLMI